MNQEQKDLLNKVGADKFLELQVEKAVLAEGYTSIEDYVQQRLIHSHVLTEVEELKIDLDFSKFDLRLVQDELNETKRKLASVITTTPIVDITMFNAMMEQFNTINDKLTPVTNFFANTHEPAPVKKRISKKEKERIAFEEHQKILQMEALASIKNRG
ncbi:MAG: hypothetical protein WC623_07765 [Pedobacter sp.]|uniref:hypothetical protein n=1 Tax=Pedobacter sp. TaxID=1411316 RepID=UPI003561DC79